MNKWDDIHTCTESQLNTARLGVIETTRYLKDKKHGQTIKAKKEINRQIACLGVTLHTIDTILMENELEETK